MLASATVVGKDATGGRGDTRGRRPTDRETSIRRSLDVLLSLGSEAAIAGGGLGVTRIADLLGREKSQVSRTLKTLAEYGLVDRDPDTLSYRLGWRIYALANLAGEARLLDIGRPLLRRLVAEFEERAFLSVLQGDSSLTILSESPSHSVQAVGAVGRSVPLYCTSVGRALLFDHDRAALERVLGGSEYRRLAPNTPTDLDDVAARIAQAREPGYAVADEELEVGHVAVAAPVRDAGGRIVAAINVSGPKFRLGSRLAEVGEALVAAAAGMRAELAGAQPAAAP